MRLSLSSAFICVFLLLSLTTFTWSRPQGNVAVITNGFLFPDTDPKHVSRSQRRRDRSRGRSRSRRRQRGDDFNDQSKPFVHDDGHGNVVAIGGGGSGATVVQSGGGSSSIFTSAGGQRHDYSLRREERRRHRHHHDRDSSESDSIQTDIEERVPKIMRQIFRDSVLDMYEEDRHRKGVELYEKRKADGFYEGLIGARAAPSSQPSNGMHVEDLLNKKLV